MKKSDLKKQDIQRNLTPDRIRKKLIAGFTTFAVVFSVFGGAAGTVQVKADTQETIAMLNYTYKNSSDAQSSKNPTLSKSKYGSAKEGYSFTSGKATLYASVDGSSKRKLEWSKEEESGSSSREKYYTDSFAGNTSVRQPVMAAGKKNQWGEHPYFEVQLSTSGYKDINFTAYIGASKKGPRDYQISYATGKSSSFTAVPGSSLQLGENKVMKKISAVIPADNQKKVKIRIEITSMTSINGGNMADTTTMDTDKKTPSMKGEVAINHITISGTKTAASDSSSSSESSYKVKKVKLSKSKLVLKKKKSAKLKATVKVSPNTKANKSAAKAKLKWSSSNKKVATVTKSGKVKAKKKGRAVITVKYSKKKKATCKVVVK